MNTTTSAVALVCSNTTCCQEAFGSLSFHVDIAVPCLCLFPRFPACNGSLAESAESLGILTSIQAVLAVAHIALLIFIVTVVTSRLSNATVGTARFSVANLTIFFCIYASVGRRTDSRLHSCVLTTKQAKSCTCACFNLRPLCRSLVKASSTTWAQRSC
jgi:hypothetical protein